MSSLSSLCYGQRYLNPTTRVFSSVQTRHMNIIIVWLIGAALLLTILVILVAIVMRAVYPSRECDATSHDSTIATLYRQCARWAVASTQDRSEVIGLLHANYAAGYLWAIKDVATSDDFRRVTGEDMLEFEKKITRIQDGATRRLVEKCSAVIPITDTGLLEAMYYRPPR